MVVPEGYFSRIRIANLDSLPRLTSCSTYADESITPWWWRSVAHAGRKQADDLIVAAIASGKTAEEAAALSGVSVRTVHRRLANPKFKARIGRVRQTLFETILGRIADGMTEAADTLRSLLKAEGDGIKLQAAKAILEQGIRMRDVVELGARLADVERRLEEAE